jgi:hypothetical protein
MVAGKSRKRDRTHNNERLKPLSLYPIKPEQALAAFMKVDRKRVLRNERRDR